ncbi:MAG: acyl-CoA dehydrogenase family protein [Deltaproteobacteria bacterium]|nr:acyl-CoA dehydrogenase family protein [Deltaproteobacteria bacterium]
MDFNLSPDEEAFRQEVRDFLAEHLPAKRDRPKDFIEKSWLPNVREKRWVGFGWPEEVGGGGGSVMQQAILKEEMTRAQAPPLGTSWMGLQWVGPGLIAYGTAEQQARFLPGILDSKVVWCTGYSEPHCGSDLAALQCKAVRNGEEYIVNGQKIWTTMAMWSDWIILLVRTSTDPEDKHAGITCLLVPMKAEGVTVRPIKSMSGVSIFAEVFFDDVHVPVADRLGAEGEGWQVTVMALANERSGISEVEGLLRSLDNLKALAKQARRGGRPALEDVELRRKLARMETAIESMRFNGLRALTRQLQGSPPSSETSINKLHRTALEVEMGELGLELQGNAGALMRGAEPVPDGGRWQHMALSWPEMVIGGGTPNIQKNIIAERILGLPKD